jgi:hypothetical protein
MRAQLLAKPRSKEHASHGAGTQNDVGLEFACHQAVITRARTPEHRRHPQFCRCEIHSFVDGLFRWFE